MEVLETRTVPTFAAPVAYDVGANPGGVVTADFNGDGLLDCAVSNWNSDSISVLLSNGDGTFDPALNAPTGPGPLALGDFNVDGHPDLSILQESQTGNLLNVLFGNGDGTFQPPSTYQLTSYAAFNYVWDVTTGDLNDDGYDDVVTRWTDDYGNTYRTALSNGDGTLTLLPPAEFGGTANGYFPLLADLDEDGHLDLVMDGSLMKGNGDGTFTFLTSEVLGGAIADFNGDGHLDTASTRLNGRTVEVRLGTGGGAFSGSQHYLTLSHSNSAEIHVGDFNGDGHGDLLVGTDAGTSVLYGNGDGTFAAALNLAPLAQNWGQGAADFNGDGYADVAVGSQTDQVLIYLNDQNWPAPVQQAVTFTVTSFPSSTTAGVSHSITVTARDSLGNVATTYFGTVHFASNDLQAVLPSDYLFTSADNGVHVFNVTLKTAGTRFLTVSDTVLSNITWTQSGITVNPAAASIIRITGPTSVKANVAFSITVTAYDAYGNVATGYRGTVRFGSSDNTATLPANYAFTAVDNGVHVFSGLRLKKKGTRTISLTDVAIATLTHTVSVNVA